MFAGCMYVSVLTNLNSEIGRWPSLDGLTDILPVGSSGTKCVLDRIGYMIDLQLRIWQAWESIWHPTEPGFSSGSLRPFALILTWSTATKLELRIWWIMNWSIQTLSLDPRTRISKDNFTFKRRWRPSQKQQLCTYGDSGFPSVSSNDFVTKLSFHSSQFLCAKLLQQFDFKAQVP